MKFLIFKNLISNIAGSDMHLQHLLIICLLIMLSVSLLCFLVSEITNNYSQVDKLWNLMPLVYGIVTISYFNSPRIIIMTILAGIWGLRLSYNFYRKGGYDIIPWRGKEDYRWKILRDSTLLRGRIRFGLFNLLFISFYQNLLILLFSSPFLFAAKYNNAGLNIVDLAASLLMLTFIIVEAVSDNQLFRFHQMKKQKETNGKYAESLGKGFMSEGLWKYVRHPNFGSEQAIWICFYFFSVAASGCVLNWSLAGAILLILLFQGSSRFTEKISSGKYPEYENYKKKVPRFIPRFISDRY